MYLDILKKINVFIWLHSVYWKHTLIVFYFALKKKTKQKITPSLLALDILCSRNLIQDCRMDVSIFIFTDWILLATTRLMLKGVTHGVACSQQCADHFCRIVQWEIMPCVVKALKRSPSSSPCGISFTDIWRLDIVWKRVVFLFSLLPSPPI